MKVDLSNCQLVETFQEIRIWLFFHGHPCLVPALVARLEIVVVQHDVGNIVSSTGRA